MANIRLRGVALSLGGPGRERTPRGSRSTRRFAIDGLDLDIPHARTTVVLGPSGCGKSTLLRVIAGLLEPTSGQVLYDGDDVSRVPPGERMIGYIFQNYALYPHFTVRENITSFFRFRRQTPELDSRREQCLRRTSELLDVDISYLLDRSPRGLSGGEKQRVALGRCITREPRLFLLDEPFSNLDAKLRATYRLHLKTLLREFSITTVHVTHDQQEAVLLGDRIAIMNKRFDGGRELGFIEQSGTIEELYDRPRSAFVADFLNLHADQPAISLIGGSALAPGHAGLRVGIRPEHVRLGPEGDAPALFARVREVQRDVLGRHQVVSMEVGEDLICGEFPVTARIEVGEWLPLRFTRIYVFERETGAALETPPALAEYLHDEDDRASPARSPSNGNADADVRNRT